MSAGLGKELTDRERSVLRALEQSLRAEDPRLAALLTNRPVAPERAAEYPAGAPYWFWWRRRATD